MAGFEFNQYLDTLIDSFRKLLYPNEWIELDLDFSKSEIFAMLLVDRHGEIIMSKIADYINVSMSTANGVVERLVNKGLLIRERNESDRRIVVVKLTEQGKELISKFKSIIAEYLKLVLDVLDEDEKLLLFRTIEKIISALSNKKLPGNVENDSQTIRKIEID